VNAYVTPVFEGNQVVGYESVRVKPTAEQIRRAEALYQRINQGKSAIPSATNGCRCCRTGCRSFWSAN
jgi:aerotaxis receptor